MIVCSENVTSKSAVKLFERVTKEYGFDWQLAPKAVVQDGAIVFQLVVNGKTAKRELYLRADGTWEMINYEGMLVAP